MSSVPPRRDPSQRYRAAGYVIETSTHGPQLCLGVVLMSRPPQGGGLPLVGWRWDDVEAESQLGTTWARAVVVGTFDGARFTLTERPINMDRMVERRPVPTFSPACADPDGDAGVTEITNGIEHIAVALRRSWPTGRLVLIEHCPAAHSGTGDYLEQVTVTEAGPDWQQIWPTTPGSPDHTRFAEWATRHLEMLLHG